METAKSFESRFARCLEAVNARNESELAKILEINPSSVSAAKKRRQLPPGWVETIAEKFCINANWLFFGTGNKENDALSLEDNQKESLFAKKCPQCAELKAELDQERKERRELAAENRKLWKENGELKEKCARLEPRQKQEDARPFDERRKIPASSEVMQSRP